MTAPNEATMPNRASDQGTYYSLDRRIPVWGIITVAVSIVTAGIMGSYSVYAANVRMAESVDRLGVTVERLQTTQSASIIKDVQHDGQIADLAKTQNRIERDIELLKERFVLRK